MEGEKISGQMNDLKIGKFVLVEGVPCRVVSIDKSKPGKHGAAKMRIDAISLFDGGKHTIMKPSDGDVEIPIINRRRAQIISVSGTTAQLMDNESFEIFDVDVPDDMRSEAVAGKELQYMDVMGKKLLLRVTTE
jgi:translation initiation factor 5A